MGRRQNQPPQNIASNPEVMAWIAKLESENKSVVRRNNLLYSALIAVVLIMLFVLFSWYRSSVYSSGAGFPLLEHGDDLFLGVLLCFH